MVRRHNTMLNIKKNLTLLQIQQMFDYIFYSVAYGLQFAYEDNQAWKLWTSSVIKKECRQFYTVDR